MSRLFPQQHAPTAEMVLSALPSQRCYGFVWRICGMQRRVYNFLLSCWTLGLFLEWEPHS